VPGVQGCFTAGGLGDVTLQTHRRALGHVSLVGVEAVIATTATSNVRRRGTGQIGLSGPALADDARPTPPIASKIKVGETLG